MKPRERFQDGSITREARKIGPAVWVFRWREYTPEGRARRKVIVGSVAEFPTKALAKKAVESQMLRKNINRETRTPLTIAELVDHYREKEMTEDSNKSYSTRTAYAVYLRNW